MRSISDNTEHNYQNAPEIKLFTLQHCKADLFSLLSETYFNFVTDNYPENHILASVQSVWKGLKMFGV